MRRLPRVLLIIAIAGAGRAGYAQGGVATSLRLPAGTLGAAPVPYAGGPNDPVPTAAFYFGDANGAPITTYTAAAGPGTPVNLSVWYQTTFPHNSIDVLVGYDRSQTATESATRLDNKIVLSGDAGSAVTNVNPAFVDLGNAETGGAGSDGPVRPYGDDVALTLADPAQGTTTAASPTHLFDISLVTTASYTGAYDVTIYSAPSGGSGTTFVVQGTTYARPPTYTLHLTDAPEPSGAWAMALGMAGLFTLAKARRQGPRQTTPRTNQTPAPARSGK